MATGSSFCPTCEPMGAGLLTSIFLFFFFFFLNPKSWYIYCSACHYSYFSLFSYLAYSSTLKIEATCFSETSVDFQHTRLLYLRADKIVHYYRCENLKFYIRRLNIVIFWRNLYGTVSQFGLRIYSILIGCVSVSDYETSKERIIND
jgi:hypothetical protein